MSMYFVQINHEYFITFIEEQFFFTEYYSNYASIKWENLESFIDTIYFIK